jgi:hypothetical protein
MSGSPVSCGRHGPAQAAFVCRHLMQRPAQRWIAGKPDRFNPWPDAWCSACDRRFSDNGQWRDDAVSPPIAVICHYCYQDKRNQSAHSLTGRALANFEAFLHTCMEELRTRQDEMKEGFALGKHERFDWDQTTGKLVFSTQRKPEVEADIEFAGSWSRTSHTWMWAWANQSYLPRMKRVSNRVRELGEIHDFRKLTTPVWKAAESDGWEMAAATAIWMGAMGIYRSPGENGASFLVLKRLRWVQATAGIQSTKG